MTVLQAMRWTLVGSIAVYVVSFALVGVDPELALLVGIAASVAMAISAFGCVVAQVVTFLGTRKHKPVEKPE
jgi:hypothetical protein